MLWAAAALALSPAAECLGAAPEALPPPGSSVASGVPTEARLFRMQYRSIDEAVGLIRPLLSEDGTILLQPRRRSITVHDRPEHLAQVQDLLAAWDVPPRNVRLTIQLIRARAVEGGAVRLTQELRGIGEALKDVTRWTDYENVGSRSVSVSEGAGATLEIDEYRIQLALDESPGAPGMVRLKRFTLERRETTAGGGERLRPIWDTVMNLKTDQMTVLGATRLEQSQKAILLTVSASFEK
jgi:hypothetical protein